MMKLDEAAIYTIQCDLLSRLQRDVLTDEKLDEAVVKAISEAGFRLDDESDYVDADGDYVTEAAMKEATWPAIEKWAKAAEVVAHD